MVDLVKGKKLAYMEEGCNESREKGISKINRQHVVVYPSQSPFVLFK